MTILKEVTTLSNGLEYSIHDMPKRVAQEVAHVFPTVDLTGMLVVPTCQRSDVDLVQMGERIENEKDRLLERFAEWAKGVCDRLNAEGYWADYIDPCSGLPMVYGGQNVYSEVDGLTSLLGYKTQNAGCCKILLHPQWGSSVYPASFFTKAPLEQLEAAIAMTPVPK